MAIVNPPAWMQQGSYSANADRLVLSEMIKTAGVTTSTSFLVTQTTTASMSVQVAAGGAYVAGTQVANQGVYHVWNNGTVAKTIATANATNPRIDRVILRVYDAQVSGTLNIGDIEIVTGTPAASPSVPVLPANSIELARITVPAGATSIITDNISHSTRNIAALNDYILRSGFIPQEAEPTHTAGWRWYQPSTGITRISNGTAWKTTGRPGYTNVTLASGWMYSSGHQMRVGESDGLVRLQGARVVRASSTVDLLSTTDYALSSALASQFRPPVNQEFVGTLYYGSGTPTPIKTMIGTDGVIMFRTGLDVSLSTAPAHILVIPPATWITNN